MTNAHAYYQSVVTKQQFRCENHKHSSKTRAFVAFKSLPTPLVIRRPTPPKYSINIHPQLFQFVFNILISSMIEKWKKMILDQDPDPDQSQNLTKIPYIPEGISTLPKIS